MNRIEGMESQHERHMEQLAVRKDELDAMDSKL